VVSNKREGTVNLLLYHYTTLGAVKTVPSLSDPLCPLRKERNTDGDGQKRLKLSVPFATRHLKME